MRVPLLPLHSPYVHNRFALAAAAVLSAPFTISALSRAQTTPLPLAPETRRINSAISFNFSYLLMLSVLLPLLLTGCGKKHAAPPPSPPAIEKRKPADTPRPNAAHRAPRPTTPPVAPEASEREHPVLRDALGQPIDIDPKTKPIWTMTGYASWYGSPYKGRKAASGEIYDEQAMTAAHRLLPLQSIIKVTNLKTGAWALLRVNDRGPFVSDRIIDLSVASAKALDIWRPGTAPVRIDVLYAPKPIEKGGRWCVQVGALKTQDEAIKLRDDLIRRYPGAKVIQFPGPTGFWVRFRAVGDDKQKAIDVTRSIEIEDAGVYLTRLD